MLKCLSLNKRPVFLVIILLATSLPLGGTVNAMPESESSPSLTQPTLRGDVDGNDIVDAEDSKLIVRYVAGQIDALPHPENADATADGKITTKDALTISQRVTGRSRIVIAAAEHGVPEKIYVGSLVRIEVFERFFPFHITGGTVRIKSSSTEYDSGEQPLVFERDGRSLYYHWATGGLSPASDYDIYVVLTESDMSRGDSSPSAQADLRLFRTNRNTPMLPDVVLTLSAGPLEIPFLAQAQDAKAPAAGIPFEFLRVFPQDSQRVPYLGPLGRGWMHNFDVHLEEFTDGRVAFRSADGFNRWFKSNGDGTFTPSPGDYGVLTCDPQGVFRLREKDGFVYRFKIAPSSSGSSHSIFRLDYMQDANRNRIRATYNADSQLSEVRHTSGQRFWFEYNEHGRISKLIDPVGRETIYSYDDSGAYLLRVTAPGNRVTSYTYSLGQGSASDHRLLSVGFGGTHLYYTYDSEGRPATQEGDGGIGRLVYTYDADGTTNITDASGAVTSIRANEQRQPTEIINPLGAITQYRYDANFNLTEVVDPLGRIYRAVYDNMGNMTQFVDPLGNTIEFEYEPNFNKMTLLKDYRGMTTSFSVDNHGNLATITYPDSSTEAFTYNQRGSLQTKTGREGQTMTYTFTHHGLLLAKTYPDGSEVSYAYDTVGNLTRATNDTGVIHFEYDSMDRLIRTTYPGDRTFHYEYNVVGKCSRMTDPDGKTLNYEYDATGRVVKITNGTDEVIVESQYDAANRQTRKTLGNGVYTTYDYDAAGQIRRLINHGPTANIISRFFYTYDAVGNRLSKETAEGVEVYTYDAFNRLSGVTYPDGITTQFVYDAMGNRLILSENGIALPYSVNDLNQYTAVGATTYAYDANGNLRSKTASGQTTTYTYDAENRLIEVNTPTETVAYTYNPFGLRNSRTDAQGTAWYLWNGNQVSIEENETYQTEASYVWSHLLDEAIQMERGGRTYYYTHDAMLSVSDLVDPSGDPIESYQYLAFGEPLASSSVGNPWLFTGLAYDEKTGLQYNRFRYYSPAIGRFISTDPSNINGGWNLYSYAADNPLLVQDPFGKGGWILFRGVYVRFVIGSDFGVEAHQSVPSIPGEGTFGGNIGGTASAYLFGGVAGVFNLSGSPVAGRGGGQIGSWVGDLFGGGTCPTFIQLPSHVQATAFKSTNMDVSQEPLAGEIAVPVDKVLLRSDIPIFGVAGGKDFTAYRVEYGEGENPTRWHLIEFSTTPQHKNKVGMTEIPYMQGDVNLRGNIATWNTGLKNWVHLPWHPPEDPTDLNGVYTLRLVVEGKSGQQVEDRVTVQVGRVIAQCRSGIAISPDKRVIMRFPEQSLTQPFRVYTILPLNEGAEKSPPTPEGAELIGAIYQIREPGDRFIKDVTLEFNVTQNELVARVADEIGIARYDVERKEWQWLSTVYTFAQEGLTFTTVLVELPTSQAIYGLLSDRTGIFRSKPQSEVPQALSIEGVPSTSRFSETLIYNTFEEDIGQWKPRDRFVGAVLAQDNTVTPDGSYALKLQNEFQGGNFSVTVFDQPFDVSQYPVMSFDYHVAPGVKTDFYLRVNGRWYNIGFTDDPINFRNRDVNITNLGRINGILVDEQWHFASVNLQRRLRRKTKHTRVDAIVMADWDVSGYMKLEFGKNARGATYYIDNFKLTTGSARKTSDALLVDNFDTTASTNLLKGPTGTFSSPGTDYCQAAVVDRQTAKVIEENASGFNGVLRLTFDTSRANTYCGYWTALMAANGEEMNELSLRLHIKDKVPPVSLVLRHATTSVEAKVPIQPYAGNPDSDGWRTVTIPTNAFLSRGLPDLSLMDTLTVMFENAASSGQGIILLDEIRFQKGSTFAGIADFNRYPMEYNLLGGGFRTFEHGASAISADYHEDDANSQPSVTGTVRISYGGMIGLDYGKGRFSYAVWETDLMGFDARGYENLVIKLRGERGGEKPNIYLDDGTTRQTVRAEEFNEVTTTWQEIRLPLDKFESASVDLSHLEALQLDFEWEEMNGTIYISEIHFEDGSFSDARSTAQMERR